MFRYIRHFPQPDQWYWSGIVSAQHPISYGLYSDFPVMSVFKD